METARIVSSPCFRFPGTRDGSCLLLRRRGNSQVCFSSRNNNTQILRIEFSDSGHTQYYQSPITDSGKKKKEKMKEIKTDRKKLMKRLARDLDLFSQSAQGGEISSCLSISEATKVLIGELETLRRAEKEQKRKRKDEKSKLAKSMAMIKSESSSSSSSSESSDCDEEKVVSLRMNSQPQITENEGEPVRMVETSAEARQDDKKEMVPTTNSFNIQYDSGINGFTGGEICSTAAVSNTKIEICMGGKCKKMGAPMLLEEFERRTGTEGVVVGCKCMGKCKSGPNVRVSNPITGVEEESVKCSSNPLYIGVGLEDVGAIVANLLTKTGIDDCLLPAS